VNEKTYTHLTENERDQIYLLRKQRYSLRGIADVLGRSVSTISSEINLNSVSDEYQPSKAHIKARTRRKDSKFQGRKIIGNPGLRESVESKLKAGRSPGSISGRISRVETHLPSISADSIERFLASPHGRAIEYERKQLKKAKQAKKRSKRNKLVKLSDRTFIDDRLQIINDRLRVGDVEADFIVSGKNGRGILLVVVDRRLRITFIARILPVTIKNVHKAFKRVKRLFPELLTITTDNDILLRFHKELERILKVPIYFCHPYHSWEKGTVENTNGIIRGYIPKGSDISTYSDKYIQDVEDILNDRYLDLLEFKTPDEVLAEHRKGIECKVKDIIPNLKSTKNKPENEQKNAPSGAS
jgi:transposase, IS30 family